MATRAYELEARCRDAQQELSVRPSAERLATAARRSKIGPPVRHQRPRLVALGNMSATVAHATELLKPSASACPTEPLPSGLWSRDAVETVSETSGYAPAPSNARPRDGPVDASSGESGTPRCVVLFFFFFGGASFSAGVVELLAGREIGPDPFGPCVPGMVRR